MKQHTLPRFYVAGFYADRPSKNPLVYVYPLPAGPWEQEYAKKFPVRDDFYTYKNAPPEKEHGLERALKLTEDRAAEPIQKLARIEDPTPENFVDLAMFVAAMMCRSPRIIEHVGKVHAEVTKARYRELYQRAKGDPAEFDAIVKEMKADGAPAPTDPEDLNIDRFRVTPNAAAHATELLKIATDAPVRLLMQMQWDVLSTPEDAPLVTCDTPVAMYLPGVGLIFGGIGEPFIEVTLALNKTTAVKIHHQAKLPFAHGGVRWGPASPELVAEINRRTIAVASKFVIGSATTFPGDDALAKKATNS